MACKSQIDTKSRRVLPKLSRSGYQRFPVVITAGLIFALAQQQVAAGSNTRVESAPAGASVFGEQRGSLYFYGFTPLTLKKDELNGDRLMVSKTGFAEQRIEIGNQAEIAVELSRDPAIETIPATLRSVCQPTGIGAYKEMVEAFRDLSTPLMIETPFTSLDVDGKQSLVVGARVVDRKGRADLRGIRRREGRAALEEALENEIKPIVKKVLANVRRVSCIDYLTVRVFYSSAKLVLDTKRIQVPWSQSYVFQQGSDIVYQTKYGTRGENVTTVKVSDSGGNYVDFFYLLGEQ